jgi:hypothetical protein
MVDVWWIGKGLEGSGLGQNHEKDRTGSPMSQPGLEPEHLPNTNLERYL